MNHNIQLIVGLGNPGAEYEGTRHNVGFHFVKKLLESFELPEPKFNKKFSGAFGKVHLFGHDVFVLLPETYMNLSGASVAAVSHFYKIPADQILVAHDDLDFPAGIVRLKKAGGDGGHNGLKDIIKTLGVKDFWRLRFGIGRPKSEGQAVSYVLNKPTAPERGAIDLAMDRAIDVFAKILAGEFENAMQELHSNLNNVEF
jgi:PTH1 family peptidyl-tRNA hydrolase